MRLLDTSLRVRHACPYSELSGAFPELEMALWCNGESDVLRVVAPDYETLDRALETATTLMGMELLSCDERPSMLLVSTCRCPPPPSSVTELAEAHGCWAVQPTKYSGGWEQFRIFSPDQTSVRAFLEAVEAIGEVELLSHRQRSSLDVVDQVGTVSVQLFSGLTDRQAEALAIAYEEGLMAVPAHGSMERAARRMGVSRSTYGEHLRKAVGQLVGNAYPFLRPGGGGGES